MRRNILAWMSAVALVVVACCLNGCSKGKQYARVIKPGEKQMVGSHKAGQETYGPLIDESVSKLLARHQVPEHVQVSGSMEMAPPDKLRVCFVGVENYTAEEIGDFKAQIYEKIDSQLLESPNVTSINGRYVEAGLREARLRPDQLLLPDNMAAFTAALQRQGQPFDYLLFAKLTSGTTESNKDYQRDYLLTLELINVNTGEQDKQSATLSKGYHHSWTSRAWSKGWPFGK